MAKKSKARIGVLLLITFFATLASPAIAGAQEPELVIPGIDATLYYATDDGLIALSLLTGETWQVTSGESIGVISISPDGALIARRSGWDLRIANTDGSGERVVDTIVRSADSWWDSTSSNLYYAGETELESGSFVIRSTSVTDGQVGPIHVHVESENELRLLKVDDDVVVYLEDAAEDRRNDDFVVQLDRNTHAEIHRLPIRGGGEDMGNLNFDGGITTLVDSGPTIDGRTSPDGRYSASRKSEGVAIFQQDAETGEAVVVSQYAEEHSSTLQWLPDSSGIVTLTLDSVWSGDSGLTLLPLNGDPVPIALGGMPRAITAYGQVVAPRLSNEIVPPVTVDHVEVPNVLLYRDGDTIKASSLENGATWAVSSAQDKMRDAVVSTDGTKLAYFGSPASRSDYDYGSVVVVNIDGTGRQTHLKSEAPTRIGWTADSQAVIFDATPKDVVNTEIISSWLPPIGALETEVLVSSSLDIRLVSAQGGYLAYQEADITVEPEVSASGYRRYPLEVVIIRLEDGAEIYRGPADKNIDVAFTPTGSTALAKIDSMLYLIDLADGSTQQIVHGGSDATDPSISPDGSLIAYTEWPTRSATFDHDVVLQDPSDTSTRRRMTGELQETFGAQRAAFVGDEDRVVVGVRRSSSTELIEFDIERNPTSLGLTGKPIAVISNVVVPLDLVASTVTAPAESDSTVTEFANNATETSLTEEEELLVEQLRAEREVQTTAERLADESYLLPNTFASDYSPPREDGLLDSRAGRRLVFGVPLALLFWLFRSVKEPSSEHEQTF